MAGTAGTQSAGRNIPGSRTSALGNAWANKTFVDLLAAFVLTGIHLVVALNWGHGNVLSWPSTEGRIATYAAGAGVMALIAGFTGTAIAQYGSSSGNVVNMLRQSFGRMIRKNCQNIMGWLLAGAILCIIAMALDTKRGTYGSQWIFEFAILMGMLKFARLWFLFKLILEATDLQSTQPQRRSAPRLRQRS